MRRISFVLALMALSAAAPSDAEDHPGVAAPARNELTVFGGISILDAARSEEQTLDLPELPSWPGRPGWDFPSLSLSGERGVGSSALFGARYTRYLKDRFAVEADFALGPAHDLSGELCLAGIGCAGSGNGLDGPALTMPGAPAGWGRGMGGRRARPMMAGDGPFGSGRLWSGGDDLTAWHYGAGATYDLLGGEVRPFLLLGAGGVSYTGALEGSDFVLRFGGGLKAWFGRAGLRLDVADHMVVDHELSGQTEHDIHASAGFSVRF